MDSSPDMVSIDVAPVSRDGSRADDSATAVEVAVIQRIPVDTGGFETRAATFVIEATSSAGEQWVYLGDGENQMIEVTAESIRRIGSALAQAFGSPSMSKDSGSTPR